MENFELKHENGKLIAIVTVDGKTYEDDVTEYFNNSNAHDEWLDYKIFAKYS